MQSFWKILTLEREDKRCGKTSGSVYPVTRRRNPEERNPPLHSWLNLRFRNYMVYIRRKFVSEANRQEVMSDSSRIIMSL